MFCTLNYAVYESILLLFLLAVQHTSKQTLQEVDVEGMRQARKQ